MPEGLGDKMTGSERPLGLSTSTGRAAGQPAWGPPTREAVAAVHTGAGMLAPSDAGAFAAVQDHDVWEAEQAAHLGVSSETYLNPQHLHCAIVVGVWGRWCSRAEASWQVPLPERHR